MSETLVPQLLSAWAGHWTGEGTGVTVILPPPGTVGSGEVRGGAPATREFALLEPSRLVDRVDAVVLSGGSAYGLAAGDGVLRLLAERGMGFPTPAGPVPIVVGMSIYDPSFAPYGNHTRPGAPGSADPLGPGSRRSGAVPGIDGFAAHATTASDDRPPVGPSAGPPVGPSVEPPSGPPDAQSGRAAALAAWSGVPFAGGRVGAGAGASTGKWRDRMDPGGIGCAERTVGPARVAAVVVVNAWGDVIGPDGRPLFGGSSPVAAPTSYGMQNTTIGVLLTDARLSKLDCYLLAQSGHTGYARAIHPAHSRFDGDAVVALASGEVTENVSLDLLRATATETMADAIRNAVA